MDDFKDILNPFDDAENDMHPLKCRSFYSIR